ncbi:OLC1v1014525C1 [Oldenlandia corymbosa var. corymbosa]|uniref:OLC1v1014525C1 n=1 Tax=Oldenlandia corymbosa var. corymbosa TaxID=529605 RepID=A0AAV1E114_OLDCO|nr:OLC1v1014525C1 [Oldenlandia corymbosa var. corymbosa]
MEEPKRKVSEDSVLNGFSNVSSPPTFWKSRRRPVSKKNLDKPTENSTPEVQNTKEEKEATPEAEAVQEDSNPTPPVLSEKRKALFEPLEPITNIIGRRTSADLLLPPPDFDAACYPKGWLIGKKRKLVNVDVVESMRRIAVQEMNRKDREIDGLNEQLEEDARCLEHLQVQLLEERSKRADVERQNAMLQNQINMLMDMLQENDNVEDDDGGAEEP